MTHHDGRKNMSDTRNTLRIVVLALTIACLADLSPANAQDVQQRDQCFSYTAAGPSPVNNTGGPRDGGGGPSTGDTLSLTHPLHNDIFRAGDIVEINGTVDGPNFESYSAEWGFGENPTEWFTTGIELANGGSEPVVDGTLALWDTGSITDAAFATLRVTATFTRSKLVELRTLVHGRPPPPRQLSGSQGSRPARPSQRVTRQTVDTRNGGVSWDRGTTLSHPQFSQRIVRAAFAPLKGSAAGGRVQAPASAGSGSVRSSRSRELRSTGLLLIG